MPKNQDLSEKNWRLMAEKLQRESAAAKVLLRQAEAMIDEQARKILELESLAMTDPLTGHMNRRGFEKFFELELARTRRNNSLGSVLILFDLDNFKDINDIHGHQAGDACLKTVSEYVHGSIRSVDGTARIGGDEFAILLTHTTPEKAVNRINAIKSMLSDIKVKWRKEDLQFAASMGVQGVSQKSIFEDVYQAADQSLYSDKRQKNLRLSH